MRGGNQPEDLIMNDGIIDLSKLKNGHVGGDENGQLASIIATACSLSENDFNISIDTDEEETAFCDGYMSALAGFVDATTDGVVSVGDDSLYHLALSAYTARRGQQWTYAMAHRDRSGSRELEESFQLTNTAQVYHGQSLFRLCESISNLLQEKSESAALHNKLMMDSKLRSI